jgi:lysophospholipase L1-like esterase
VSSTEDQQADTTRPRKPIDFALPNKTYNNQTFRMIVRPDVWGRTVRLGLSNVFSDRALTLGAATIGLQESGAYVLIGTNTPVTFNGKAGVSIPAGGWILSDRVTLPFVTAQSKRWLKGRNLAVSFATSGQASQLSYKWSEVTSFISPPNSGDHTADENDTAFPYGVQGVFVVNELDVLAEAPAEVVCVLGESISDFGGTVNGYDLWSDVLSRRLHEAYGDRLSVVNMAVGANAVFSQGKGPAQPVVQRLERDVLSLSGLTTVVWMQGHNEIFWGNGPDAFIDGYKTVAARLHARGIKVVAGTLTSGLWPNKDYAASPLGSKVAAVHGSPEIDAVRRQMNSFIRDSGVFDQVVDMAAATDDPKTGALYETFHVGDHLHLNRAGRLAMGAAIDLDMLVPPDLARSPQTNAVSK